MIQRSLQERRSGRSLGHQGRSGRSGRYDRRAVRLPEGPDPGHHQDRRRRPGREGPGAVRHQVRVRLRPRGQRHADRRGRLRQHARLQGRRVYRPHDPEQAVLRLMAFDYRDSELLEAMLEKIETLRSAKCKAIQVIARAQKSRDFLIRLGYKEKLQPFFEKSFQEKDGTK